MHVENSNRWKHFAAMALIGDGVMALVRPQRDARAWSTGPKLWQDMMNRLHDNPALTRAIGVAQIVGGIWWALREEKAELPITLPG
jgi:hypothetical protein